MGTTVNLRVTQYASAILGDVFKLTAFGCGVVATFDPSLWPAAFTSIIASLLFRNLSGYTYKKRIITSYIRKEEKKKPRTR